MVRGSLHNNSFHSRIDNANSASKYSECRMIANCAVYIIQIAATNFGGHKHLIRDILFTTDFKLTCGNKSESGVILGMA